MNRATTSRALLVSEQSSVRHRAHPKAMRRGWLDDGPSVGARSAIPVGAAPTRPRRSPFPTQFSVPAIAALWLLWLLPGSASAAAFDGQSFPSLPDGEGGLAGLAPKQVETIRKARDAIKRMAASEHESYHTRCRAIEALERIHEALNDWGRNGQLEWYLDRLRKEPDEPVREVLVRGAMLSAKARQYHLGGVHAFWRQIHDLYPGPLPEGVQRLRDDFDAARAALATPPELVPSRLKLYWLSVPRLHVDGALRPYKEPKPRRRR